MRVLLCNRDCQISGGTTYLLMLAEGLAQLGHEVTLAAGVGMVAERFKRLGVRRVLTLGGPLSSWSVQREAARCAPDAVVYGGRGSCRDLAVMAVRQTGAVGVCVLQDHVKSAAEARALNAAHAVIALERPIYEQALAAGARPEALHVWPRPVLGGAPLPPAPHRPFRVLWMGRMSGHKGWSAATLIEAAPSLCDHIENLQIQIIGGGSRARRVRRAARAMNAQLGAPVIQTRGPTNDPLAAMRDASLVVGGGYTCLEALYNHRPAVACGFEWMGPVTRERIDTAYDEHFGDRSSGRTDAAGLTAAVCDVHDALLSGDERYSPSRDWFPVDHSTRSHAERVVNLVSGIGADQHRRAA